MRTGSTVVLLVLVAAAPMHRADRVAEFRCKASERMPLASVGDVYRAYSLRSAAIMRAALARDTVRLEQWVSPTARFIVIQGDVGVGPRSVGVPAAIEFAKQINPRSYEFSVGSSGPFSMNPCGSQTAELTLKGDQPDEATAAAFKYQDGILSEVQGSNVDWFTGTFPVRGKP